MKVESNTDTGWIASVPGIVHLLDGQHYLFHPTGRDEQYVLTQDVLQVMNACRKFRPLERQVIEVNATLPRLRGQEELIRRTLEQLLERSLFITSDEFGKLLTAARQEQVFEDSPPLIIRTCERPGLLERMLESGLDYERDCGKRLSWLVLDDTPGEDSLVRNQLVVEHFAQRGLNTRWLGPEWQRGFAADLARATGVPGEVIDWALMGKGAPPMTAGRLINQAILLTAGSAFLLLDDDYRIDARQAGGIERSPRFGEQAPWNVHFPDGTGTARSFGDEPVPDPLAVHLESCGQPLGAIIGGAHVDAWHPAALAGCEVKEVLNLGPESRVLATIHGTRGSPRTPDALWLHLLSDETGSFRRFVGEPEGYQQRAACQWIIQTRHQPTFVDAVSTSPAALDNRRRWPCTLPGGRAEDLVLATAAAALYPADFMLDYPQNLHHEQESRRERDAQSRRALNLSLSDLVASLFMEFRQSGLSCNPERRLAGLSQRMADLATAPETARFELFREAVTLRRSAAVRELDQRIRQFEGPNDHPWLADAREILDANRRALAEGEIRRFRDRDDVDSREDLTRVITEQCGLYARALECWPVLWDYCRGQRERLLAL